MTMKSARSIILGSLLAAAVPALAHHGFMAEFDKERPVTVEGVVTNVLWENPHTFFHVDVKAPSGAVTNWTLETGSPSVLIARGWNRGTLKPGDHVIVHGYQGKKDAHLAAARSVTMPDGRPLQGGQTDDGGPMQ